MLAQIFLINLVAGNHTDRARGLAFFSITPEQHWKGMQGLRDCIAEKGLIPCVGCVWVSQRLGQFWCRCSWFCNELTSLAIYLLQLLNGLTNPTMLAWLCFVYPWLCVSLLFPLFLGESCPARGWHCSRDIKEHAVLWLGGTLQRRSQLRNEFLTR